MTWLGVSGLECRPYASKEKRLQYAGVPHHSFEFGGHLAVVFEALLVSDLALLRVQRTSYIKRHKLPAFPPACSGWLRCLPVKTWSSLNPLFHLIKLRTGQLRRLQKGAKRRESKDDSSVAASIVLGQGPCRTFGNPLEKICMKPQKVFGIHSPVHHRLFRLEGKVVLQNRPNGGLCVPSKVPIKLSPLCG